MGVIIAILYGLDFCCNQPGTRFGLGPCPVCAVECDGQRGVLRRVEDRNEIVELEDETDLAAARFGEPGIGERVAV